MNPEIFATKEKMGAAAAKVGAARLAQADSPSFIVATGASQFETLANLTRADLDWPSMTGFHLDEYIGLPISHPASFRKYLWERFVSQLPLPLAAFHFLDGEADIQAECKRVGGLISQTQIEVAFVGIGENGHLAFNDPPADFETKEPYIVVDLDDACRRQQSGEGWFPDFESVPKQAVSMSIQEILRAKTIICTVPDQRKAEAVKNSLTGPVTPDVPASILQTHPDCRFFLDEAAASLL
ncbi:MAG: glucosamine-6-phosphate deaminase [Verrucomicrobiales bacterium]|nr:glucosamine-6-phosphate deaminase [Verrucomicrobiales bacterium]